MMAYGPLSEQVVGTSSREAGCWEPVIQRVAHRIARDCERCQHVMCGRKVGHDDDCIVQVRKEGEVLGWSKEESPLLRTVDDMLDGIGP